MLICFSLYDEILSSFPTHKTVRTLGDFLKQLLTWMPCLFINLLNLIAIETYECFSPNNLLPSSLELSVDISISERTYCFQKNIFKNDKICRFQ